MKGGAYPSPLCPILPRIETDTHLLLGILERCFQGLKSQPYLDFLHQNCVTNNSTIVALCCQDCLMLKTLDIHAAGSEHDFFVLTIGSYEYQSLGPVVQSIVCLTRSLRGQLVKCFMT